MDLLPLALGGFCFLLFCAVLLLAGVLVWRQFGGPLPKVTLLPAQPSPQVKVQAPPPGVLVETIRPQIQEVVHRIVNETAAPAPPPEQPALHQTFEVAIPYTVTLAPRAPAKE